jgi:hypothetical protein
MCHNQAGQLLVATEESNPTVGAHLEILSADHERAGGEGRGQRKRTSRMSGREKYSFWLMR